MANTRVQSFVILTLLQLCRTQTTNSNQSESWYLANMVNDNFSPKSISEIFSTESPFSPTNPIVVWPKSTFTTDRTSSTPSTLLPPTSFEYTRINVSPLPSSSPLPPSLSTASTFSPSPSSQTIQRDTERTSATLQSRPEQATVSTTPEQQTASVRSSQPSTTSRFLIPDELQSTWQQPASSPIPGTLSGSFIIYQNGPGRDPTLPGGIFGTPVPEQLGSSRRPDSIATLQPTSTVPPSSTWAFRDPMTATSAQQTLRPSTPISLGPATIPASEGMTTRRRPSDLANRNLNRTQFNNFGPFPFKIRVMGPRGAITNVNINPRVVVATPTTTTKRPTTTRTRKTPKSKRNTYEACLNGCKALRDPICAIPLSSTRIDPEKLKGFPSICHMACFNSYRKDSYEKLSDGRCGRLRTRIHTLDSNSKLKRDELHKAQYVIDGGDQTIVEVSPLFQK